MENQDLFLIDIIHEGGMATFEVTPNEGQFSLSYNDEVIADIKHDVIWKQTSGENLPAHILNQVVSQIENHYRQHTN